MRLPYTLLLYLALPFVSVWVWLRSLRDPEYRRGGSARFGFVEARAPGGIWVHAVSVGEVQAAAILIAALQRSSQLPITLTCATPTGRARARALLPQVAVSYAPYDLPGCVRRAFRRIAPARLIIMETELWPNLLHAALRARVPTLLASARLSERTARVYRALPGWLQAPMASNVWVGAQSEGDAQRYRQLGVPRERVAVVGNIKFEREPPPHWAERGAALRSHWAGTRPVWVAGSTHAGEEEQVLAAQRQLLAVMPDALLVLAPRHPARFDTVAAAAQAGGWQLRRRSAEPDMRGAEVLLLDTLGELGDFYAATDAGFVGGSLVPIGGHNLLEPVAVGVPALSGEHLFNSPDIARALLERGALIQVRNAEDLARQLTRLLQDRALRERMASAGRSVIDANRGALARLLAMMAALPAAGDG